MPIFIDRHRCAAVPSAVRRQLHLEVARGLVDEHGVQALGHWLTNGVIYCVARAQPGGGLPAPRRARPAVRRGPPARGPGRSYSRHRRALARRSGRRPRVLKRRVQHLAPRPGGCAVGRRPYLSGRLISYRCFRSATRPSKSCNFPLSLITLPASVAMTILGGDCHGNCCEVDSIDFTCRHEVVSDLPIIVCVVILWSSILTETANLMVGMMTRQTTNSAMTTETSSIDGCLACAPATTPPNRLTPAAIVPSQKAARETVAS
jgi:hypothetical protein